MTKKKIKKKAPKDEAAEENKETAPKGGATEPSAEHAPAPDPEE